MKKTYYLILLLCCFSLTGQGSTTLDIDDLQEVDIVYFSRDTGQVKVYKKFIDKERIEAFKEERAFKYDVFEDANSEKGFLYYLFEDYWDEIRTVLKGIYTIRYLLLGLMIIFFLVLVLRSANLNLFAKGEQLDNITMDEINPEHIEWEKEIRKAEQDHNYRLAVRCHFLKGLKILSRKHMIQWRVEKTNYDYLMEIKEEGVNSLFNKLCFEYEAIWYGNFDVDEAKYLSIVADFNQLDSLIDPQ